MFGRYELNDLLGRGGMGEVYRAVDTVRDRTVALKLLPRHLAADESFKTRFRRESRMAARLNDPHIIPIHDFGEIDGQLFIDMRLVEGRDLGSVLAERGSLPPATAVTIISQVASALEAAHESGLVHRDVKPSNVLLAGWTAATDINDLDPFAYLVDFGIARSANQEGTALTATSGTVGTVAYMSPERIGGSPGDRRTDIYALGCVLYETITGHKPFDGEMFAIMYAHMNAPAPRVTDHVPDAPRALDDVIAKAMAKNPDDRYPTANQFALAARQALRGGGQASTGLVPPGPVPQAQPSGPVPPRHVAPSTRAGGGFGPATPPPPGPPPGHPSAPVPAYQPYAPPPPQQAPVSQPSVSRPVAPAAERNAFVQPQSFASPPPAAPPSATASGPGLAGVRPAGANESPRGGATGWPPATDHPSGPVSTPIPPRLPGEGSGGGRKRGVIIGAVALVALLAVGLILVLSLSGGSGSPSANGSSSSQTAPHTPTPGSAAYQTGGPNTPAVSWDHFGSFSMLAGKRDGDSSHAFQDANCSVAGKQANEPDTIGDEVVCTYPNSTVTSEVARFTRAGAALDTLHDFASQYNYDVHAVQLNGHVVGLLATSPDSATYADTLTYVCGLPNYLVEFYAKDKKSTSADMLKNAFWGSSTFPDLVPEPCTDDFSGPAPGTAPSTEGVGALKTVTAMTQSQVTAWLLRGHTNDWQDAVVAVPTGQEIAIVGGPGGAISFWSYDTKAMALRHGGFSKYPSDPATLGTPQIDITGALLTNMQHATFIVHGNFSTDQSGNAVAYSYNTAQNGWGAIKAATRTTLQVTTQPVTTTNRLGLSENFQFDNGNLVTSDCAGKNCDPSSLIVKTWKWDGSEFALQS